MAQPLDTPTTPSASLSDRVIEPRGKVLPLNSENSSPPEIGTGTLDTYVCFRRRATSADRRQAGRNGERASGNLGGGAWGGPFVVVGRCDVVSCSDPTLSRGKGLVSQA